ncbi:MAG: response regulator [Bryobacteraceae bacterium]|nr:response regulator [Bryobacteraceae bacterium]
MKAVHTSPIQVLLVSPNPEDRYLLGEILSHPEYSVRYARSAGEARRMLASTEISVVLSEAGEPDGWAALLDFIRELPRPPRLIVTARHAGDRLWGEVLNLGGFDVLAKPWAKREVTHSVRGAHENWRGEAVAA